MKARLPGLSQSTMQQNCNSCIGYLTDWLRYPPDSAEGFNGRVRWKAISRNAPQLAASLYNLMTRIPATGEYMIQMRYNMAICRERSKRNRSLFGMSLTHDDIRSINIFGNIFIIQIIGDIIGTVEIDAIRAFLEDTACIVKKGVVEEWLGFVMLTTWKFVREIHNEHTTGISAGCVPYQSFKAHRPSIQIVPKRRVFDDLLGIYS